MKLLKTLLFLTSTILSFRSIASGFYTELSLYQPINNIYTSSVKDMWGKPQSAIEGQVNPIYGIGVGYYFLNNDSANIGIDLSYIKTTMEIYYGGIYASQSSYLLGVLFENKFTNKFSIGIGTGISHIIQDNNDGNYKNNSEDYSYYASISGIYSLSNSLSIFARLLSSGMYTDITDQGIANGYLIMGAGLKYNF